MPFHRSLPGGGGGWVGRWDQEQIKEKWVEKLFLGGRSLLNLRQQKERWVSDYLGQKQTSFDSNEDFFFFQQHFFY